MRRYWLQHSQIRSVWYRTAQDLPWCQWSDGGNSECDMRRKFLY